MRLAAPAILQRDDAVENRAAGRRVDPIGNKVAMALELKTLVGFRLLSAGFEIRMDYDFGVWIQRLLEVFTTGIRMRVFEQAVVQANFGFYRMRGRHPMNIALDLVGVGAVGAAFAVRKISAMHRSDVACFVFIKSGALNNKAITQTYPVTRE